MRTFPILLLGLLFLTFSRVAAQETFAPLISENCVAFVHVDFSKVEIDTLKGTLKECGEHLLGKLGFDDRSLEATMRELNVELEKWDMLIRPVYDTITNKLGIKEYAVIVDWDIIATNHGVGVIAVPWKNKTEEQLETLKKLLLMTGKPAIADYVMPIGDFVLLPIADNSETVAPIVKGWLEKKGSSPAIFEAMKSVEGNEVKIAVALPESIRTMVKNAPLPPDVPVQVRDLLLFASQKIQWASASVSFHGILGGEAPKNNDVFLTVKTNKRSDAEMLRGMLEQFIEFGINTVQFGMQQQPDNRVPPLAFQFAKGLLRTLLPDVEEEKLVFRMKGKNSESKRAVVSALGVGAAMFLPAVQAMWESGRRINCSNNMAQIGLAIHNFHDVYNAMPPLYTVDKDGKPMHSWRVLLLPFIEQQALYEQIRLDEPWDSEYNKQFHHRHVEVYRCPSNASPEGMCYFSAIAGQGFIPAKEAGNQGFSATFARLSDGTSNTIAVVEVKEPFCWMDPTADITLDELLKGINKDGRCGSHHSPGGCYVLMFDGTVRFIRDTIESTSLRALATPNGGEFFTVPDGQHE